MWRSQRAPFFLMLIVVSLGAVSQTALAQSEPAWVTVFIAGKPVMGFVPPPDAESQKESGVCSEVQSAKTANGQSITSFEFRGWKDGEIYRLRVFAFVLTQGQAASKACSPGTGVNRVEFAQFNARLGDEIVIDKVKNAGVTPWTIRVGPHYASGK